MTRWRPARRRGTATFGARALAARAPGRARGRGPPTRPARRRRHRRRDRGRGPTCRTWNKRCNHSKENRRVSSAAAAIEVDRNTMISLLAKKSTINET